MGHGRGQGNKQEGSFGKGVHHSCFATRRCVNGLEGGRSKVSGESLRAGWPFVWIARDRTNRPGPVPVPDPGADPDGLVGNRSVPVEFKFELKKLSSTGSYRFTSRFDRFTGRFDRFEFKSKFKIACVTGLERYTDRFTGRFDRFTKWALMSRLIFFGLTLNARKVC